VAALAGVSLLAVDSCTSCGSAEVVVNGQARHIADLSGAAGVVSFGVLALWISALAGVLGADHLQQSLEDGSASLVLSRPVRRSSFVLARLLGVVALTGAASALLLGGTTLLLTRRAGLSLPPALLASSAVLLAATASAGLSMALSLALPRMACVLTVLAGLGLVGLANTLGLLGQGSEGLLGAVDRLGPPLLSAVVRALDPWIASVTVPGEPTTLALRLLAWAALGVVAPVLAFSRMEIRG